MAINTNKEFLKLIRIVIIICFICGHVKCWSQLAADSSHQERHIKRLYSLIQIAYNRGFGTIHFNESVSAKNNGYLVRLRAAGGYFLTEEFSIGGGIGMEGYHMPSYNLFPVVTELRYYKNPQAKTPFVATYIGYAVRLNNAFEKGIVSGLSLGYKLPGRKKSHVMLSAGIDLHQIRDRSMLVYIVNTSSLERINTTFWLTSFSFSASFLFHQFRSEL